MSERPIESYALASYTAAKTAAVQLGYESGKHAGDLSHPDVLRAQKRFEDADERHQRWVIAVERVLDTEAHLIVGGGRAGDSSKVHVIPDDTPDAGRTPCKTDSTSEVR